MPIGSARNRVTVVWNWSWLFLRPFSLKWVHGTDVSSAYQGLRSRSHDPRIATQTNTQEILNYYHRWRLFNWHQGRVAFELIVAILQALRSGEMALITCNPLLLIAQVSYMLSNRFHRGVSDKDQLRLDLHHQKSKLKFLKRWTAIIRNRTIDILQCKYLLPGTMDTVFRALRTLNALKAERLPMSEDWLPVCSIRIVTYLQVNHAFGSKHYGQPEKLNSSFF